MPNRLHRIPYLAIVPALAALLLFILACGSAEPTVERPITIRAPDPAATGIPADAPDPTPTTAPADTPNPTATSAPADTPTSPPPTGPGSYDGVTYAVGEGSEATFTVEEKLASLPLPNDAVVRTTALSGEVHFDGRPSVIEIDLHKLESDQSRRDRYIRERMFPNDPIAVFTLPDTRPLPDGFAEGEEVATEITGQLTIRGVEAPVTFQIEARDDGDVVHILGRTSFVWADFGMTAPSVGSFVRVTDEVAVEILISARSSGG